MFVNDILLIVNPFFEAYIQSDLLGKLIFMGLIFLSICTWIVLLYKVTITYQARKRSERFKFFFKENKNNFLQTESREAQQFPNPFYDLYQVLKKQTVELLNKNRLFGANAEEAAYLSSSDIDIVSAHLTSQIALQIKFLEKNLFILSTIVSLGPFLGLLGTVWGILTTFSEMQALTGSSSQMVLNGLSLALTTTVLGLVDAIPALIGYNYLKNTIRDFEVDMEGFSTQLLAVVEMQYRKVNV